MTSVLQTKLAVGEIDDPLEHEADRVADQVMRMPSPEAGPALTTAPPQINSKAADPSSLLQRKCADGDAAPGLTGECAECRANTLMGLQTKLRINETGDPYEHEADRVAEQVLAEPVHREVSNAPPYIRSFSGRSSGQRGVAPASVDRALAESGGPLEPGLRQDMELRFGHDFSRVRVHSGLAAAQSARDVNAHAYTVGHDIVFGAGQFLPGTREGRRLIAHELTHVRQQSLGQATKQVVQRNPDKDDWSSFETTYGADPRFVFWAEHHGKPPANYGEIVALLDNYHKAMDRKDVLEEYDQAQLAKDRAELEKRRQAARAVENRSAEAKPGLRQKEREKLREQNRTQLYEGINKAWNDRRRYQDAELMNEASYAVAHNV